MRLCSPKRRVLAREELVRETKKSHKPEFLCRLKQTQATPATPATATMLAITATTTTSRKGLLDTEEDTTQTGVCPPPARPRAVPRLVPTAAVPGPPTCHLACSGVCAGLCPTPAVTDQGARRGRCGRGAWRPRGRGTASQRSAELSTRALPRARRAELENFRSQEGPGAARAGGSPLCAAPGVGPLSLQARAGPLATGPSPVPWGPGLLLGHFCMPGDAQATLAFLLPPGQGSHLGR